MNRYKAFATHVLLSVLIVGIFFAVMRLVWYPDFYFDLLSATDVLIILASVDIVLGPLITLIIFVPGKKGLKFDLTVIAIMQLSALFYGGNLIHEAKPVYVAYAADMFKIASLSHIDKSRLKYPEMVTAPSGGPMFVFAKIPTDPKAKNALTFEIFAGGPDVEKRTELYEPLADNLPALEKHELDIDRLRDKEPGNPARIDAFFAEHGSNKADFSFHALVGNNKDMVVVLVRKTGEMVGVIDIDPWLPGH